MIGLAPIKVGIHYATGSSKGSLPHE